MAARGRDVRKEAFWRREVWGQAGSGVSVRAWCRTRRLNEATFYWWRRELGRRDARQPAVSFVPVQVTGDGPADRLREPPESDCHVGLEIVLTDGRRVRITGPVNPRLLTDVLDILERRPC